MSVTPELLPINSTVSFEVYPAQFLGTGFTNAKVMGVVQASQARFANIDPVALHASVYATLPEGTPNKYDSYLYVILGLKSGETTAVGLPWIRPETLRQVTTRKMQLILQDIDPNQEPLVLRALSANGFKSVDVSYPD
jgi:hypothetical protein